MASPTPVYQLGDPRRAYAQGIMAGGEPMDPEIKAKMIAAWTPVLADAEKAIQDFRNGVATANTEQMKARLDAEVGFADAIGEMNKASAMSQQAKSEYLAALWKERESASVAARYREGDPTKAAESIKVYNGTADATGRVVEMNKDALTQAVTANSGAGSVIVGPDGSVRLAPQVLRAVVETPGGFNDAAKKAQGYAQADYDNSMPDAKRVATYINQTGAAAAILPAKTAEAIPWESLTTASGQKLTPEQIASGKASTEAVLAAQTNRVFTNTTGDIQTALEQSRQADINAEKDKQATDKVAASYGINMTPVQEWRNRQKALAEAGQTMRETGEDARGMNLPADLLATRDYAADQISKLDDVGQSPFAVELAKLSNTPEFKVFAEAYGFKDTVQAGIYIARHPKEYTAAAALVKNSNMKAADLKEAMSAGRKLGVNATTGFQRAIDEILKPNAPYGVNKLPLPGTGTGAPSIAEREAGWNDRMNAQPGGQGTPVLAPVGDPAAAAPAGSTGAAPAGTVPSPPQMKQTVPAVPTQPAPVDAFPEAQDTIDGEPVRITPTGRQVRANQDMFKTVRDVPK